MDVEGEGGGQADAQNPQQVRARHEVAAEVAQRLAVGVDLFGAEIHLQVSEHVRQDVPEQHDPGDGHHPLLAHRRGIELEGPGARSLDVLPFPKLGGHFTSGPLAARPFCHVAAGVNSAGYRVSGSV